MSELSASIELFAPIDIILLLTRTKKDGCLVFQSEGEEGKVFVKDGKVVHAQLEEWAGGDALLTISLLDSGSVEFESGAEPNETTITDELALVSKEFDRRRIKFKELREKLPTYETVLYKSPEPVDESLSLRRSDWQILALIDGKRNLGAVIKDSKLGLFDAINSLDWLMEKGLVTSTKVEVEEKIEEEAEPEEKEEEEEKKEKVKEEEKEKGEEEETKEAEKEEVAKDWATKVEDILNIFLAEFAGKGAVLKKWQKAINQYDKTLADLLEIAEDGYSINREVVEAAGGEWWHDNLNKFLDSMKGEGAKIYGKILGRKKWEKVEKRLSSEGSE